MDRRDLRRSKFIEVVETGETLARISVEANSNVILHLWSKVRKTEVSIPLTELIQLALSACKEQNEDEQQAVLIRDRFIRA